MLTIDMIREKAKPLAIKYGVRSITLFGSYANGNATEESDVDLLVQFNEPPLASICEVLGFEHCLADAFGKSVDVVPLPIARPDRLYIERTEAIYNV
ncbi:MAG: nucleotidyltransferase domain-containing protein [Oscillospiraceae bacterium]|jgi:predicted nucleotidyltransferase|nr:nucleotidyltransferase domain-containing protein [Oscillospiraceae bacterium]